MPFEDALLPIANASSRLLHRSQKSRRQLHDACSLRFKGKVGMGMGFTLPT